MFKDKEPSKAKECCWLGEKRLVEIDYGGDYSTNSENTNPYWKAIHIHGKMEHNLVEYAKYYYCGCIKISRNGEFTREINHNRKKIPGYW